MTWFEAVIIAIVEGLTEYLPVSSTGHMMITQAILGVKSDDFVKLFTVNIQFGAILAVVVLYWKRFLQSLEFYYKLLIAFIPAAIIGLLFGDEIDLLLENVTVVAYALLIGGIILLFVDKLFEGNEQSKVGYFQSLIIGIFQCIALIRNIHYLCRCQKITAPIFVDNCR
jgi:undecaprenyl-diphosphatase